LWLKVEIQHTSFQPLIHVTKTNQLSCIFTATVLLQNLMPGYAYICLTHKEEKFKLLPNQLFECDTVLNTQAFVMDSGVLVS